MWLNSGLSKQIENVQLGKILKQFEQFLEKERLDNFEIKSLEELETNRFIKTYLDFLNEMEQWIDIIKSNKELLNTRDELKNIMIKSIWKEIESVLNRLNKVLSQKIEDNQIGEEEYIKMIKKINIDFLKFVLDLKSNSNIYQLPCWVILNKEPKIIFNIAKTIENDWKIEETQMELLSDILKNNVEAYIYNILASSTLSDDEKIEKIASFNENFIEDVYFFQFRWKVEKLFWEIFAYNSIWEDLVEKVILNKRSNTNKYIRLSFIENIPDITQAMNIVDEYGIWFRSWIALLTRIYEELEKSYDEELNKEYKKYKQILLERKSKKNLDIEEEKIWEEFTKNVNNKFNAIKPKEVLTNTLSDKNKKTHDLYTKIQNGVNYADIKEELSKIRIDKKLLKLIFQKYPISIIKQIMENHNIDLSKKDFEEAILSVNNITKVIPLLKKIDKKLLKLIFQKYSTFIIKQIMKNNNIDLSKKDFEEAILSVDNITKVISLLKKIEQDRWFKFDKYKFFKNLVDKAQNFFDIINIRWNDYFKDFKLEFIDKKWKINKKHMSIFIKMLLKSKERQLTIQTLEEENIEQLNASWYMMQWISPTHAKIVNKSNTKKPVLNISI